MYHPYLSKWYRTPFSEGIIKMSGKFELFFKELCIPRASVYNVYKCLINVNYFKLNDHR